MQLNNRIDILNKKKKWLEARIIQIEKQDDEVQKIKIHYKGYNSKHDEIIDKEDFPIRVKSLQGDQQIIPDRSQEDDADSSQDENETDQAKLDKIAADKEYWRKKEEQFKVDLDAGGYQIIDVGGDGNCLFRAVAYQIYGDEDQHRLLRVNCMKYIEAEKQYFGNYIEGGLAKLGEYVTRKSCNGIWGDDIEV